MLLRAVEHGDLQAARTLLEQGANANNAPKSQRSTLLSIAVTRNATEMVELLLAYGADPNQRDATSYTPLCWAAMIGNQTVLKLLISKGADVNARLNGGGSPLHHAAGSNHGEAVELLRFSGAEASSSDNLYIGAALNDLPTMEQALAEGAAPGGITANQWNKWIPLEAAARNGQLDAVRLLIARGARVADAEPITGAAEAGHANVVEELLKAGAPVEASRSTSPLWTPLHAAASGNRPETVGILLNFGASTRAQASGFTPLMVGARNCSLEAIKVLLDRGADVNERGAGHSALIEACGSTAQASQPHERRAAVVRLLLEYGADVNAHDDAVGFHGYTALQLAVIHLHRDISELLLAYGADVHAKDRHGRTPLDEVHRFPRHPCRDMLENAAHTWSLKQK